MLAMVEISVSTGCKKQTTENSFASNVDIITNIESKNFGRRYICVEVMLLSNILCSWSLIDAIYEIL